MTVSVTLTFASIDELIAHFATPRPGTAGVVAEQKAAAAPKAAKQEKPAATPAAAAAAPKEAAAPAPAAESPSESKPEIEYSVLQKAVVGVATRGASQREQVLKIAADLGKPTFKELPPELWAKALAEVNALAERLDAEAVA